MATKPSVIATILIIAVVSIQNTCQKKSLDCANTKYSFQIGARVYPEARNINIGDTLWLDISSPTSLTDISFNKILDYSGASNLGTVFGLDEISNKDSFVVGLNFFDYSLVDGKPESTPLLYNKVYSFVEKNSKYLFKLGIIPKQKVVLSLGISDPTNVYGSSDYCAKARFIINIENKEHHYYLNTALNPSNYDTTKPSGSYYLL